MGIMPVDREQKWQRIFRRFGLPAEAPEPERKESGGERDRRDSAEAKRENWDRSNRSKR